MVVEPLRIIRAVLSRMMLGDRAALLSTLPLCFPNYENVWFSPPATKSFLSLSLSPLKSLQVWDLSLSASNSSVISAHGSIWLYVEGERERDVVSECKGKKKQEFCASCFPTFI